MRAFLPVLLFACAAWAQPTFEAASLKPNKSPDFNSSMNTRSDNVEAKNMTRCASFWCRRFRSSPTNS